MEVICIDDDFIYVDGSNENNPNPVKGVIYTVIDSYEDELGSWYSLQGFPEDEFGAGHFVDITNLSKEIQEALKAKTPIKRHLVPLTHELDAIGYTLPGHETKWFQRGGPFESEDSFNERIKHYKSIIKP